MSNVSSNSAVSVEETKRPKTYIPTVYRNVNNESEIKSELPKNVKLYVDDQISRLMEQFKNHDFETFDKEDLKPNVLALFHELQDACVLKSGGQVVGPLHILSPPQANFDAANKEYVDWLFSTLKKLILDELNTKFTRNFDLDVNHFKIKNVQPPTAATDVANKEYVDNLLQAVNQRNNYIFSKGSILGKKTFFFNPGFICPNKLNVCSISLSTSPYKYKIGERRVGENPIKLFAMINNEIRSEHCVEKDQQLGYLTKDLADNPIILQKGDNFMLVIENSIEDSCVTLMLN